MFKLVFFILVHITVLGNTYKFPADTSFHFATRNEGQFTTSSNYLDKNILKRIPLALNGWEGEDLSLKMDLVFHRYYEKKRSDSDDYDRLYFLVAHGSNESNFHAAEVCYFGSNWVMENRSVKKIKLNNSEFPIRYGIASKDGFQRVIMYWYFWPDENRQITRGMTMFRLAIDVYDSVEEANKIGVKFIQNMASLKLGAGSGTKSILLKKSKKPTFSNTKRGLALKKSYEWLKGQMTPNNIVPNPVANRRNLILSYVTSSDNPSFKYIFSKSSIYDNALAIISFSMLGDYDAAEKIVRAAKRAQSQTGKLWFTYNTHNTWPNDKDEGGAIVRNGASAWLGYSVVYYLKARSKFDPQFKKSPEFKSSLNFAKTITDYIVRQQIQVKDDRRYGLVTGGEGSYYINRDATSRKPVELFRAGAIEWNSIEHNIDTYYLFRDLGKLSGVKKYTKAANLLKSSLLKKSWNNKISQFNRGHNLNGPDPLEALDTASWGAMFLQSIGKKKLAKKALIKTNKFVSRDKINNRKVVGHKPYINMLVYESKRINQFFYPDHIMKNWNHIDMVWYEGTFGVLMAEAKLGRIKAATKKLNTVLDSKVQNANGAFPYATKEVQFQFTKEPSVASTAWFIMLAKAIEDKSIRHSFWGKD